MAKKSWITSGPVARYVLLFAMSDPDKHARGITSFMIDTKRDGFSCGKTEPKLGNRASATCEIEFDGYRAQADEVIGEDKGTASEDRQGWRLHAGRIGIASQAVGVSRRGLSGIAGVFAGAQGVWRIDRQLPDDPAENR